MDKKVIEKVARFCVFSGFDHGLSQVISQKAIIRLRRREALSMQNRSEWIKEFKHQAQVADRLGRKKWSDRSESSVDLTSWKAFFNSVDPVEVEAVLLSQILGFSDLEISDALGVSEGTVRYRTGHGLRKLGGFLSY